ncbi:phosphate ABC transporter permease [Lyngbya confervoides]|uniref:Phosphate ABC transporter permease n=1 Tax=Lyngbya confervoides BDU141951 TaxID=1574623 RepID=A0ABD4T9C9_9CYAN|nr:phosphate ABC transporter permease [Lyngbya confervoides]MCM1984880.1 phosphate ABC transporter permease [Lyngbya confervoides BDU141951]
MLVPITRSKFEQLMPLTATGAQYQFYWGKTQDLLRRCLISLAVLVVVFILTAVIGEGLRLLLGLVAGLYWLWAPVLWATLRNRKIRQYPYSGFWQGRVYDVFISEDLIGTEESVNQAGQLVIVENRERRINLELEDRMGTVIQVQAPLQRNHRPIRPGDRAELLILSRSPDLSPIEQVSDVYIPNHDVWVSDYPYLQRQSFEQVSRELAYEHRRRRRR